MIMKKLLMLTAIITCFVASNSYCEQNSDQLSAQNNEQKSKQTKNMKKSHGISLKYRPDQICHFTDPSMNPNSVQAVGMPGQNNIIYNPPTRTTQYNKQKKQENTKQKYIPIENMLKYIPPARFDK